MNWWKVRLFFYTFLCPENNIAEVNPIYPGETKNNLINFFLTPSNFLKNTHKKFIFSITKINSNVCVKLICNSRNKLSKIYTIFFLSFKKKLIKKCSQKLFIPKTESIFYPTVPETATQKSLQFFHKNKIPKREKQKKKNKKISVLN